MKYFEDRDENWQEREKAYERGVDYDEDEDEQQS